MAKEVSGTSSINYIPKALALGAESANLVPLFSDFRDAALTDARPIGCTDAYKRMKPATHAG